VEIRSYDRSELPNRLNQDLQNAIKATTISIKNHGNPRLIDFSINVLSRLLMSNAFSFEKWQSELSKLNFESKFIISRLRYGNEILVSQANLLLSASAVLDIADSMIHYYYCCCYPTAPALLLLLSLLLSGDSVIIINFTRLLLLLSCWRVGAPLSPTFPPHK
jgi:hypothetical protein